MLAVEAADGEATVGFAVCAKHVAGAVRAPAGVSGRR